MIESAVFRQAYLLHYINDKSPNEKNDPSVNMLKSD